MTSARELRARAQRLLAIAAQISDQKTAAELRRQAADFHARAVEIETPSAVRDTNRATH